MSGGGADRERAGDAPREERISPWEWVTGALGLALVIGALVVLGREAAAPASTAELSVTVDSVRASGQAFVAHFTVANGGRAPVMDVTVAGRAANGQDTLESTASISYVPGHARRSGGLLFPADPAAAGLRLRVTGYEEP